MPEINLQLALFLTAFAFLCEYVDSTLGMGYGTTLTPVLMLMGFSPAQIVPSVLLSELISGIFAAIAHHKHGNVNLKPESSEAFKIKNMLSPLGYIETVKKTFPRHLKIALLLALCSIIGTVTAVFVAVNISKFWLKIYISSMIISMGIIILVLFNRTFKFSWKKISILGIIASFNKGLSGGGYGPLVTSGQILSGLQSKNAIGITSLAEGLTCLVGIICYALLQHNIGSWELTPYIIFGAIMSVPLSVKSVKFISSKKLKIFIAAATIILGIFTLTKTLLDK